MFSSHKSAIIGARHAREFLATNPTPEKIRKAWNAASFANDAYDLAFKQVIKESGVEF